MSESGAHHPYETLDFPVERWSRTGQSGIFFDLKQVIDFERIFGPTFSTYHEAAGISERRPVERIEQVQMLARQIAMGHGFDPDRPTLSSGQYYNMESDGNGFGFRFPDSVDAVPMWHRFVNAASAVLRIIEFWNANEVKEQENAANGSEATKNERAQSLYDKIKNS